MFGVVDSNSDDSQDTSGKEMLKPMEGRTVHNGTTVDFIF
jgi:hypothetical protein